MVICFLFQADRISFGKIKGFQRLVRDEKRFLSGPACFLFFVATFASIPFERRRLWFVRARFRVHKDGGQKQAKDSRHATCEDDLRARGTMSDPPFVWHPPSAEPPPPRETLFPRRPPFMRATRVASDRSSQRGEVPLAGWSGAAPAPGCLGLGLGLELGLGLGLVS